MSDGSFAQTSVSSRQQHTLAACSHDTTLALSIAHQSDLLVSTDQGRLFLHLPLRNDPRFTGQGKLPVPRRSSSSCGPFRALLRTAYRESAQGRNGRFLSRHQCYICCSRLTQKNLIAPQWRRIAICEESRTNTQSQVSLLLPQTLLSTRKGSSRRPPGRRLESFTSRTRSEVCPGMVCKAPISSDCNLAELASPVPVRF